MAFVTLKSGFVGDEAMAGELREHVAEMIGKIARPHGIIFTDDLPKTRSGKIMRRLLRDVAHGRALGRRDDPGERRGRGADPRPVRDAYGEE